MNSVRSKFLIIMVILALTLPQAVLATSHVGFFMDAWISINLNEDPTALPKITLTDNAGGNFKQEFGVGIMLPAGLAVAWDKTVANVTIGSTTKPVQYSADQKKVTIPVDHTFVAGEKIEVRGLIMRVYDQGTTYQNFAIDVNGDGVADATGVNGFQVDQATRRTDRTPPFEVSDVKHVFDEKMGLSLSWKNPVDVDFIAVILTRIVTVNGVATQDADIAMSRLDTQYIDTKAKAGDNIKYVLKAKDYNANLTQGVDYSVVVAVPQAPEEAPPPTPEVTPPVIVEENTEEEIIPVKSVVDVTTQAEIDDSLSKYTGISSTTQNLKEVVYLLNRGVLTADFRAGMRLNRQLKYGEFADIAGKAFNVELKKPYRNAYYFKMKEAGFIAEDVRPSHKVRRRDAFRILLRLSELGEDQQTIVEDIDQLRWYLDRQEVAFWIVRLLDSKAVMPR